MRWESVNFFTASDCYACGMKKVFTLLSLLCVSLACRAAQPGAELMAKVSSCTAEVAAQAGRAMLGDPHFLDQPIELFGAALQLRRAGFKNDAAFMYLAARLRTMRQMLFQKGDLPQLVAIMQMSIAPPV